MEACSQACLKGSQTAGLEQAVWEECFEELVGGQGLVAGSFDGEEDYQVLECWSALVVVDVEQDCWVFVCYLAFFGEVAFVAFRFEQREVFGLFLEEREEACVLVYCSFFELFVSAGVAVLEAGFEEEADQAALLSFVFTQLMEAAIETLDLRIRLLPEDSREFAQ